MLNHREYVGGDWENIGKWQMETLQKLPEFYKGCKFLDIACGSLRLGSLLIPYLNEGKYHGLDNNYDILMAGVNQELVHGKEKNPKFLVNDEFDFSFCPNLILLGQTVYSAILHYKTSEYVLKIYLKLQN